uniref:Uncharacterized protein n=1 Tax=Palpitomonas bilix TaxID=652834 RepID=A0A7S3D2N1_9EUKA|mmetsp:Transcript_17514/g.43682  ORF Transcript_17514/g.43682 Transcript_17514/m.43682 type:complete len:106 (+) Transcript_17514:580-897(+)
MHGLRIVEASRHLHIITPHFLTSSLRRFVGSILFTISPNHAELQSLSPSFLSLLFSYFFIFFHVVIRESFVLVCFSFCCTVRFCCSWEVFRRFVCEYVDMICCSC